MTFRDIKTPRARYMNEPLRTYLDIYDHIYKPYETKKQENNKKKFRSFESID
tara:strand:- start:483 stop:638 length:156 start_codon:yes stop_codon:yes gene_type:complete